MAAAVLTRPRGGLVRALVQLRFRVLANTLRRSPVLLVATILGVLQALLLLGIVLLGVLILAHGDTPPVMRELVPVIAGSVLLLGWIVLPLAVAGTEPTLDPRKLAPFPIPVGTLMRAMLLVGLLWTPAAATVAGIVISAIVWWRSPAAVLATLLVAPLAVVLCIVGSRCAATLAEVLVAGRGLLRRALSILVALVVLLVPSTTAVLLALQAPTPRFADEDLRVPAAAALLADTPLGSVWSIPGHVANGRWAEAGTALFVTLALLALLLVVWRQSLVVALRSGSGSATRAPRSGLGVFRLTPATPTGAIAARSLVSWLRDPRYTRHLAILPGLPILLVLFAIAVRQPAFAYAAAPAVAGLLPLTQFAAISFDGTAFAGQLAAGVPGAADRTGRAAALLLIATPAVVLVAALSLLPFGQLSALPAVLGLALGAMLAALAVSAVSSAVVVVPAPPIGRNPFGAVAGANTTNVVGSYVVTLMAGAAMLPALILGLAALVVGGPLLGWAALLVGVLWGALLLAAGIRIGGRLLDRNAPALFARLSRMTAR